MKKQIALIIYLFFAAVYFIIVICNHFFFRTYAFDYGAYNFAFYDYAHFRISACPVYQVEHMSFLQDHVSFTLMLFIPFYWILTWLTGTYTLLLIQTCLVLFGGWAVYKLINFKTRKNILALLALLQYFLLAGRWTSFFSDCNFAIMGSSMIPVLLYYFEKKKYYLAISAFIFILFTREDMALWTLFIGIFLLIIHYRERKARLFALGILGSSLAYFIFVFKVIIPLLETPYHKFLLFNYSALGNNPQEAFLYIIKHPLRVVKLLFINNSGNPRYNDLKAEFYIYYLLCGGFLLFYRPKYIILFIPILAKKMLNDDPIRWSTELYYSIEFVSILPIAVFLIISETKRRVLYNIFIWIVGVSTLFLTIYELHSPNRRLNWWGDSKYAFYKCDMYRTPFNVKKINRDLKLIPSDASISASGSIVPHLAFREKIYFFPRTDSVDYIAVFLENDYYPLEPDEYVTVISKYLSSENWNVEIFDNPLLILKRGKNLNTELSKYIINRIKPK